MLLDWDGYLRKQFEAVGALGAASPSTVTGYQKLHAAGAETNHLGGKVRELICIAVAVTTRCDGCIANHVKKAAEFGATREEVAEALGVAVAMNAGAAIAYSGRAMDAFEIMGGKT